MFLTVLSAIALTVGSALTIQQLNEEDVVAAQESAPIVEVQTVQPTGIDTDELAK